MEAWPSLAYGSSLENCRVEMHREFESHRFRQVWSHSISVSIMACHAVGTSSILVETASLCGYVRVFYVPDCKLG